MIMTGVLLSVLKGEGKRCDLVVRPLNQRKMYRHDTTVQRQKICNKNNSP